MKDEQMIKDLISHEEWTVKYHKKKLEQAKIRLNALKLSLEGEPLDIDAMLSERKYDA